MIIIPDNEFDLHEANNDTLTHNMENDINFAFTGGSFYSIYKLIDKKEKGYILHGNSEELYNIFIIEP